MRHLVAEVIPEVALAMEAGGPANHSGLEPSACATGRVLIRRFAGLEWLVALFMVSLAFTAIQTGREGIIEEDSFYHIKVAALIRQQGVRLDFPWLRFTILNEAAYTDHHLLFHILQAPFTVFDLQLAAKVSAVMFAALAFWGCYWIMRRSGVRWAFAWLVVLMAVAHTFLWRQSMARPQSLALLLLVGVFWLIVERRVLWLAPLGFVSVWLFDGFILVLAVPVAAFLAALLVEQRLDWQPPVALGVGTAIGMVLHPYFPHNVVFATLHLLPKSGLPAPESVRVGNEWYPFSSTGFALRVGPALAVLCLGLVPILIRLWRQHRPAVPPVTLALLALGFLALQVRSQRVIEYFPAFATLLAAWSWSAVTPPPRLAPWLTRLQPGLVLLAALVLGGWVLTTVIQARRDVRGYAPLSARADSYREASSWLVDNSPPGSLVYNTDWDDFPQLFFWDIHNVYVVGLDPTYMSLYDSELYHLWRAINSGGVPNPSQAIRDRFGAEYVLTDTLHTRFLLVAADDPDLEEVFRSSAAVVFRLR